MARRGAVLGTLPALLASRRDEKSEDLEALVSRDPQAAVNTGSESPSAKHGGPVGAAKSSSRVLLWLRLLSVLLWVVTPLVVLGEALVPALHPSCAAGTQDLSYLLVLALLVAYACLEAAAWDDTRAVATLPEVSVLRTFGILRARKWLFAFGALEIVILYNDITFPLLAFHCGGDLTHKWADVLSQQHGPKFPLLAPLRMACLWGLSALIAASTVSVGLWSLCRLFCVRFSTDWELARASNYTAMTSLDERLHRMPGADCMLLSSLADQAGLPSVARLSQELGWQRRFVFDAKDHLGGALGTARAREDVVFGRRKAGVVEEHELRDREQEELVEASMARNLWTFMFSKVLVGNVLQLWMQVIFLELAFERLGPEAKGKLAARIGISSLHVVARLYFKVNRCDCVVLLLGLASVVTTVWASAHAVFAFACPSHMWRFFGGCIA